MKESIGCLLWMEGTKRSMGKHDRMDTLILPIVVMVSQRYPNMKT